jgi:hypothetical protein
MTVITNIEDLRVLAQKRVPRMFYDYVDTGSWTEGTYRANEDDFQKIKFRQRVAINMDNRTTAHRSWWARTWPCRWRWRPWARPACNAPTARSWRRARPASSACRSPCRR